MLFDEGAQRSFTTTALANLLGELTSDKKFVPLSAFGVQTTARRELAVAIINFIPLSGKRIPLRVLVVDKIATLP